MSAKGYGARMNESVTIDRPDADAQAASLDHGLCVVSIAKSYDKKAVLTDVSLAVDRGEVLGLLGPNGAGKTTCFYSIMGLVKPDSGRILLDGNDITGLPIYPPGPPPVRGQRHSRPANLPPRDPRPRLPAAGNLDLPRPHRLPEHHGGAG